MRLLATNCEQHSRGSFQNVSKRLRVFSFSRRSRNDSLFAIFFFFFKCSKISHDKFSLKMTQSRRGCLKPVRKYEKCETQLRGWRPMKLNYDWLETEMKIWHSGRECRTTIARVSRDIRATCMRTPGEFEQYLQQHSCDIRKCVVKYRFSVILIENCR